MREIKAEEAYKVYECLESMNEHHNKVSVYFKRHYPAITTENRIKEIEQKLKEGKSYIAVVEDNERVIAFCTISIDGSEGTVDYLAILEEARGKGYGKALMEWALNKFQELDISGIEIKVVYGNDMVDMYKKYGFKEKSIILRMNQ